jgi:hypothetical protein
MIVLINFFRNPSEVGDIILRGRKRRRWRRRRKRRCGRARKYNWRE